jgi:hypothetical protein
MDSTEANTGRSMKKWEIICVSVICSRIRQECAIPARPPFA